MYLILGAWDDYVNLQNNWLSCCGVGFNDTSGMYTSFNYSAPRLPAGMAFSYTMHPAFTINGDSVMGLR